MTAPPLSSTPRSTPNRTKHRTVTERRELHEVLDAGLLCHLGLVLGGSPVVLPTCYAREGEKLYLHGSTGARGLRAAAAGIDVCVTVTHLDGIVYARSLMHHSMNYRSAVVHGVATSITERDAKLHALRLITEHLAPGSWDHARAINRKELAATLVLEVPLTEASVKVRATYPGDDREDIEANEVWAGVLPLVTTFGAPIPSPDMSAALATPEHVTARRYPTDPRAGAAAVLAT